MKKIQDKFTYLLSDPELKDEDLNKLYDNLKRGGLDECFDKACKIRKILVKTKQYRETDLPDPNLSEYEQKIINEVDRLLRKEAKMTVRDAINALCEKLYINIPSNKKSFKDQLLYLSDSIEGSKIISVAHNIRNNIMNKSNTSAWPLKENQ